MPLIEASWATGAAPASEQLGLWAEVVNQAFVPVTVQPRSPGRLALSASPKAPDDPADEPAARLHSSVGVRRFGPLTLAEIVSGPQVVTRSAEQIAGAAGGVYFLNMPLMPGASVGQDGRMVGLAPGEFALIDGDRPFELDFAGRFTQVSLTLPREAVHSRLADPQAVTGRRIAAGGLGAWAGAALRSAAGTGRALDGGSAAAMGDRLLDLVLLAAGGTQLRATQLHGRVVLQAALDEVERSLADPGLSPAVVAERLHVSVRQLHNLFAVHGPTFGRWLAARRLHRAHSLLSDPAQRGSTVAEIAELCGFSDPAYLARVFKATYGLAPTAVRPPMSVR